MARMLLIGLLGMGLGFGAACAAQVDDGLEGDRGGTSCAYYGGGGSKTGTLTWGNWNGEDVLPKDARQAKPDDRTRERLVKLGVEDWKQQHAETCGLRFLKEKLDPERVCKEHGLKWSGGEDPPGCAPEPDDDDRGDFDAYLAKQVLDFTFYVTPKEEWIVETRGEYVCGIEGCFED